MERLVTEGRRQPLGDLALIVELELRLANIDSSEDVLQIFPFRVKREYWAFPQYVAHYLARA
eukprot:43164-Pyramimonas_sp.AAC.1